MSWFNKKNKKDEQQMVVGNPELTTPLPIAVDDGEDNFDEDETPEEESSIEEENNSREWQKRKGADVDMNPYDYTKSVFKSGVEKSFYDKDSQHKFLDNEFDVKKGDNTPATNGGNADDTQKDTKDEQKKTDNDEELRKVLNSYDDIINKVRAERDRKSAQYALTDDDIKKIERREKNARILAGIGDAANSFHQAYAYARGIKPMTENKSISEKTEQRIREAQALREKRRDEITNFDKIIADLEGKKYSAILSDRRSDTQEAMMAYRTDKLKADIQKATTKAELDWAKLEITRMLAEHKITKEQHDMLMKEWDMKIKQQKVDIDEKKGQGQTKRRINEDGEEIVEYTTYGTPNSGGNSGGNSGNTPPSKQKSNTPPSRQK